MERTANPVTGASQQAFRQDWSPVEKICFSFTIANLVVACILYTHAQGRANFKGSVEACLLWLMALVPVLILFKVKNFNRAWRLIGLIAVQSQALVSFFFAYRGLSYFFQGMSQ
ncbi:MAG: hypothetical protein P1V97_07035 [Planctomycetota bacterium]|nr:hypothetical protein [Planctomycetota bacterium]